MTCNKCGAMGLDRRSTLIDGLCRGCAYRTPGARVSCPSCGCPLVERVEGLFGEWLWRLGGHPGTQVHYCPEHGCDLEAEFHLARRAKVAK